MCVCVRNNVRVGIRLAGRVIFSQPKEAQLGFLIILEIYKIVKFSTTKIINFLKFQILTPFWTACASKLQSSSPKRVLSVRFYEILSLFWAAASACTSISNQNWA